MTEGVKDKTFPGAVALVRNKEQILYAKAFGRYTYEESSPEMVVSTQFDLASLTKVISTTPAVELLYQMNLLKPEDPVIKFFPQFDNNGKRDILVKHLLLHTSGIYYIYIYIYTL